MTPHTVPMVGVESVPPSGRQSGGAPWRWGALIEEVATGQAKVKETDCPLVSGNRGAIAVTVTSVPCCHTE